MLVLSYYLFLGVFKVIMEMKSSKCVVLKLNSAYFMFNFVYCIGVFNELVFDILQTLIYNALSATEKLSWEIIKSRDYYSIHLLHAFSLICINVCRRRKTTSEIFFSPCAKIWNNSWKMHWKMSKKACNFDKLSHITYDKSHCTIGGGVVNVF